MPLTIPVPLRADTLERKLSGATADSCRAPTLTRQRRVKSNLLPFSSSPFLVCLLLPLTHFHPRASPFDAPICQIAAIRDAVREEKPITVVLRNAKKDGTPFWNLLHVCPIGDMSGQVAWYFGVQARGQGRRL